HGRALHVSSYTFVSDAALAGGLERKLKMQRRLVAVENTRGKIGKKSMIHNSATPKIEIDPETYDVRADGELLVCEPPTSCRRRKGTFCFEGWGAGVLLCKFITSQDTRNARTLRQTTLFSF